MLEVKYVVMPITIEQKKEFNRQGFRVIDARFAPEGVEVETVADGVERTVAQGPKGGKPAPDAENVAAEKAKKAADRKAAREAKKNANPAGTETPESTEE